MKLLALNLPKLLALPSTKSKWNWLTKQAASSYKIPLPKAAGIRS